MGASAGTPSVSLSQKGELACDKMGRLSMSHFTVFSIALPLSALSGTSIIVLTGLIFCRKRSQRLILTL